MMLRGMGVYTANKLILGSCWASALLKDIESRVNVTFGYYFNNMLFLKISPKANNLQWN